MPYFIYLSKYYTHIMYMLIIIINYMFFFFFFLDDNAYSIMIPLVITCSNSTQKI